MADIGYNTRYAIETGVATNVFTELVEVYDCKPPEATISEFDQTHYQSPGRAKEFGAGLTDNGTAMAAMNYFPNSVTDQRIETLRASGLILRHRITYPNGTTVTFPAFVSGYTKAIPLEDRITAEMSVRVAGAVVIAAGAIPVVSVLPAISGIAQVGQTLTVFPGVWSGGPTFTYQWQANSVNIGGATGPTYVPIVGQIGQPIRCVVTATNSVGAATPSNSMQSPNVIA
jgi:predicted secreted protein